MKKGCEIVTFRQKGYKIIGNKPSGAIGEVVLLKDEVINEQFICKKYSPSPLIDIDEKFFDYFIEEIKILFLLNHKNIVRVYTYYLYPENNTGYILMEHIKGDNIAEYVSKNPNAINGLFKQIVEAFSYIHNAGILHRDIKPSNILVTNDGLLKVIDFGFGKKIEFDETFNKSISLNIACNPPAEFNEKIYDYSTEIYFVGQLFRSLIEENHIEDFSFTEIVYKMCERIASSRYTSFLEVERAIIRSKTTGLEFSESEIRTYRNFSSNLYNIISKIEKNAEYKTDIAEIIRHLENIHQNSLLEECVYNYQMIINVFISGDIKYYIKRTFPESVLKEFVSFIKTVSVEKQKIVLNNIWQRLDSIPRYDKDDDLPF